MGILNNFSAYHPALIALAILCIAVLIQSFLAGIFGLAKGNEIPGKPLRGDHDNFSFRSIRAYGNSVENLPAFGWVLLLAIIGGASPKLVNWLAGIHVTLRLIYWGIYYAGVGKVAGGPRTMVYVLAWLVNLVLAIVALLAYL